MKKFIKIITPVFLLSLSIASISTGAYCWYTASRKASVSLSNISVKGSDFNSVECIIFRGDGATYNCSTDKYYDVDGNEVTGESFAMLEYDRLITEKNTFNNLVFAFYITYNTDVDVTSGKTISASLNCSSSSIFAQDETNNYSLSDVTKGLYKINDGTVDADVTDTNTALNVYQNATSYLNQTDDASSYQGFLSEDATDTTYGGLAKNSSKLDFALNIPASGIVDLKTMVFCNLAYNEDYLEKFFTYINFSIGDSTLVDVSKQTIDFISDLSFELVS